MTYVKGDFTSPSLRQDSGCAERVEKATHEGQVIFYLAVADRSSASSSISSAGEAHRAGGGDGGSHVLASRRDREAFRPQRPAARELNADILRTFRKTDLPHRPLSEGHLQSIMASVSPTPVRAIGIATDRSVQITAANGGREKRGNSTRRPGVRDMVPTCLHPLVDGGHGAPTCFDADAIRTKEPTCLPGCRRSGRRSGGRQYGAAPWGEPAKAFVTSQSRRPIEYRNYVRWNWRSTTGAGLACRLIRTGKHMAERRDRDAIRFKQAPRPPSRIRRRMRCGPMLGAEHRPG